MNQKQFVEKLILATRSGKIRWTIDYKSKEFERYLGKSRTFEFLLYWIITPERKLEISKSGSTGYLMLIRQKEVPAVGQLWNTVHRRIDRSRDHCSAVMRELNKQKPPEGAAK